MYIHVYIGYLLLHSVLMGQDVTHGKWFFTLNNRSLQMIYRHLLYTKAHIKEKCFLIVLPNEAKQNYQWQVVVL